MGESLPADLPTLFSVLRKALLANVDTSRPFVMAGYSSGGWLAHGLAEYLEEVGPAPAAVVLLDIYLPMSELDDVRARFMREQIRRRSLVSADGDSVELGNQLSAMGGYMNLFDPWKPARLDAPVLLVRASESMSGLPIYQAHHQFPLELCTLVNLPGNHFTLISQYDELVGRAVHDWLTELQ
jgi:surfactin synthase thioesterase subunit